MNVQPPTREQIDTAVGGVLFNASNYPRQAAPHILGQDIGPLRAKVTDAVLALLSQPTPSAECTCGYGGVHEPMNPRCERNGYRWTEPVSIADMAPGTTFTANLTAHRFLYQGEGTYRDEWTLAHVSAAAFDPSTIRDVTPPPATHQDS